MTPSPATTYVYNAAIVPAGRCYFSYSASLLGIVIDYTNPNTFAITIPTTNGSTNADGSKNEVDNLLFNPQSQSYDANTSELPTTFLPGVHTNAVLLMVPASFNGRVQWILTSNQQTEENYAVTLPSGPAPYDDTFSGPSYTSPFVTQMHLCTVADAAAARALIGKRGGFGFFNP